MPSRSCCLVAAVLLAACAPSPEAPASAPSAPTPAAAECVLPDVPLIVTLGEMRMAPGETDTLTLYSSGWPGAFDELPEGCRVVWSLSPGAPARIGAETGVLAVSADAADGTVFAAVARVAGRESETEIRVVDPAANPLVGTWSQTARIPCEGGGEEAVPEPIRELRLDASGRFGVTWMPFESYTDYWGTYAWDRATGALSFTVEGENFRPGGLDLEGRAELEGRGVLRLTEMWLGSRTGEPVRHCGMVFRRTSG